VPGTGAVRVGAKINRPEPGRLIALPRYEELARKRKLDGNAKGGRK
jgi:hypothetical protein